MDLLSYNRDAWNQKVNAGNPWTVPVTSEQIVAARAGHWSIVLTPQKNVPREWFPDLRGAEVLALASGGGQQGPILAAAGAKVAVLDNSPAQLAQDRAVAERDGLEIETIQGDMADLSRFQDSRFDFIVHPCSNGYTPDVNVVWREAFRVLKKGGSMIAGFCDPILYAIDPVLEAQGIAQLKYSIPYSDLTSLTEDERRAYTDKNEPMAFGHTWEDQIGGQIAAGFVICGFYGDGRADCVVSRLMPCFGATLARKL